LLWDSNEIGMWTNQHIWTITQLRGSSNIASNFITVTNDLNFLSLLNVWSNKIIFFYQNTDTNIEKHDEKPFIFFCQLYMSTLPFDYIIISWTFALDLINSNIFFLLNMWLATRQSTVYIHKDHKLKYSNFFFSICD